MEISEHRESIVRFSVAMTYAFADWVDGGGVERARFIEGALLTIRGLSVNREAIPPWFGKLNETPAVPSGFSPPRLVRRDTLLVGHLPPSGSSGAPHG